MGSKNIMLKNYNKVTNKDSEKYIEAKLAREIKKAKGLCIKLLPLMFTGLPDRLILLPGGVIHFIETKSLGDSPRKRQLFVHRQLASLGFIVLIIDSNQKLNDFLKKI